MTANKEITWFYPPTTSTECVDFYVVNMEEEIFDQNDDYLVKITPEGIGMLYDQSSN